ncbi:MAG: hypothetical protein KBS59_03775 [Clostridiales bacterium]|nr:hypothetical protein [Clostridiales bacterium]
MAIAYDGIPEAFRAMKDDLETGATFSMIYEKANNKFSIVEALYNEAEMK